MLKDLQNEKDERNIFISNIGICNYKLPIKLIINNKEYFTICNIASNVTLDENSRGAHLSRIIEVLNKRLYNEKISIEKFDTIIKEVKERSETAGATLEIDFDIIMKRISPVSKKESFFTVNLKINSSTLTEKSLSVSLLGTMLCPCSKEISDYSAHNQKCMATVTLFGEYEKINLEELIDIMAESFSAKVYSTVKREDEKYITEKAYENAKFSEDLIRDLLIGVGNIYDEKIVAELINYESIHEHNVYAKGVINNPKRLLKKENV